MLEVVVCIYIGIVQFSRITGQRRSPRRLERHPIYVLNVTIPPDEVDTAYEPRKAVLGYKVSHRQGNPCADSLNRTRTLSRRSYWQ